MGWAFLFADGGGGGCMGGSADGEGEGDFIWGNLVVSRLCFLKIQTADEHV